MHIPSGVPPLSPFNWGTPTPSASSRQSFSKIPGHPEAPGVASRKGFLQDVKGSNQKPLSLRRGQRISSLNINSISKPKSRVVELSHDNPRFTSPLPTGTSGSRPPRQDMGPQSASGLPPLPGGLQISVGGGSGLDRGFPTPLGNAPHRSNAGILTPSITNLMSFGSPLPRSASGAGGSLPSAINSGGLGAGSKYFEQQASPAIRHVGPPPPIGPGPIDGNPASRQTPSIPPPPTSKPPTVTQPIPDSIDRSALMGSPATMGPDTTVLDGNERRRMDAEGLNAVVAVMSNRE